MTDLELFNSSCIYCGNPREKPYVACKACMVARCEQREFELFNAAQKLTQWDGPVYDGDYWPNLDDFISMCDPLPEYVWACTSTRFVKIHIDDITESICDDAYENFNPKSLKGLEELEEAIKQFNSANTDAVVWNPDYTKAVLLAGYVEKLSPPPRADLDAGTLDHAPHLPG